jgi:hypothetical protein
MGNPTDPSDTPLAAAVEALIAFAGSHRSIPYQPAGVLPLPGDADPGDPDPGPDEDAVREEFERRDWAVFVEGRRAGVANLLPTREGMLGRDGPARGLTTIGRTHLPGAFDPAVGHMIGWLEIWEERLRELVKIAAALPAARSEPAEPTIWSHGNGAYSIDRGVPLKVSDELDSILTAFREHPVAMATGELKDRSGVTNISRAMRGLAEWSNGIFAEAVCRPRAKSQGGYFVRVRSL